MSHLQWISILTLAGIAAGVAPAAEDDLPRRVRRPDWPQEVRGVFFEDARKHLSGERPLQIVTVAKDSTALDAAVRGSDEGAWSERIDAESLGIEIKRVAIRLTKATARRGAFLGGRHQDCRRDFSLLAAMFRIAGEYDQSVRWQKDAPGVEQRLLSAADACESASEESWTVAKEASRDLSDLIRGSAVDAPEEKRSDRIVERSQLMLRMEMAFEDEIAGSVADKVAFRKGKQAIVHESQVLAALAKLIGQEEFEYADDDSYQEYGHELTGAAVELTRAAREGDFEAAEVAVGRAVQACNDCHEGFRG